MKIKMNILMILILVVSLAFTSNGVSAETPEFTINIGPDTLADAAYATPYEQQLTADGGTGPYSFTVYSGALPPGITLSDTGLLSGFSEGTDALPGIFTVTIDVRDSLGGLGSRTYDLVLAKGTPSVTFYGPGDPYWNDPFDIYTEVSKDTGYGWGFFLEGTVAYSIDGIPVPGCDAVPYLNLGYKCEEVSLLLDVGPHTVEGIYTPSESLSAYYTTASNSVVFNVQTSYYYVAGSIFGDANQDGVWDAGEYAVGSEFTINLDQDCDETADYTVVSNYWGNYQFNNIPGGFNYCLAVDTPPGYVQTTQVDPIYLNGYTDSVDIGLFIPSISISPYEIPSGSVGVEYSQTFTASGGTEPYTFSIVESTLPDGLTLSAAGVLSGIPTTGGNYAFTVQAEDSDSVIGTQYYLMDILIDGNFTFTSSANPSSPGDSVTFTVSATGDAVHPYLGPVPPFGNITFFADGIAIEGCSNMLLNLTYDGEGEPIPADQPVACTTSALEAGTYQITADFDDWLYLYKKPVLALTQEVQVAPPAEITISPETLYAEYFTALSIQLTASGGTEPYIFSLLSGTLPNGVELGSDGLLSGFPMGPSAAPGTYPIDIQVVDAAEAIGSHHYDLYMDKGTPTVSLGASSMASWNNPFPVWADVTMPINENAAMEIQGTIAFSIDGIPIPGCGAVTSGVTGYMCESVSMPLDVGTHMLEAAFTPSEINAPFYYPAGNSVEFTVQNSYYLVMGSLFSDSNQDGVWDYVTEYPTGGWTVNLDQNCDETVDFTTTAGSYFGDYSFTQIPGGFNYCISVDTDPGYIQTNQLDAFYLSASIDSLNVGLYYPTITVSPYSIPDGNVGVEYSQAFTASGGTEPYTFSISDGTLPDGFTFSETGALSGTPATAGSYYFTVQAQDATQAVGMNYYYLNVMTDGTFTFTSSANPSAPGDPITFTITATGVAVDPYFGQVAPGGEVTFYADGVPIYGCSNLFLNLDFDADGYLMPADHPAVCTTSALAVGSHQITVDYYSYYSMYNTPSLTLTQEVQTLTSADLSITNTDSKDPVKPGTKMVYTIKVNNAGPDAAHGVVVVDTLDRDTTLMSTSAPKGWRCTYADSKVTCTSSGLASDATVYIKISVLVNKSAPVGKDLVNNAEVTSLTVDPNLMNNDAVQKTRVVK